MPSLAMNIVLRSGQPPCAPWPHLPILNDSLVMCVFRSEYRRYVRCAHIFWIRCTRFCSRTLSNRRHLSTLSSVTVDRFHSREIIVDQDFYTLEHLIVYITSNGRTV
ncbi:hypothetical protein Y032_0124g1224 [Ancylostoma ceylanicum]|uniref:Uncharacterized protein n=1 Tax=Ancylostoma ceylanicum TaxID=53326 RepID=A0A016T931_9BILA|nr:hypothetical protein Y032_0124g1224 [Ancylostoma ceylanicum]